MASMATRQAFGDAIVEIGSDPRVVVIDGDLKNSTYTEDFLAKYPERFVECGIAESNMVGIAAGLALSGKVPWACSFSAFITGRSEVIRVSVCYNRANVRLVGTHVGIGIGDDGATQMALQDIAQMRALSNMTVIQPCDRIETIQAVHALLEHDGPVFLRLMRQATEDVHGDDYRFTLGKADVLRDGSDVALIATGALVQESLKAADALGEDGIAARVINIHTIKPLDAEAIARAAADCGAIVTAEDHAIEGGLGGAVAEAALDRVVLSGDD
ncbi:MAG TPA: transketolase C-terminal domain-containing protein, partial [Actinomycetota bacterium]|nr:transketolase C-terminal domain-containing protein [Actinomycetota bacterium]